MNTTNEPLKIEGEEAQAVVAGEESSAEWKAKAEKLEDALLRAKADFQNLQKRSAGERTEAIRFANADLMRSLVKVLDDFDRALAATNEGDANSLLEGVRLVRENFMKALADHGLESIDALYRPFDPSIHEALMQIPTDAHPAGTVVEQAAKGYRLSGRVVRPAKVIVSKAATPAEDSGPTE